MPNCTRCGKPLGGNNASGVCARCQTRQPKCYVCGKLAAGGHRACVQLLRQIHEAHANESDLRPAGLEERIARYTEQAANGLPLC